MRYEKRHSIGFAAILAAVLLTSSAAGLAQPAGIDPEATKILRRMTDFLASQKQFRVETQASLGVVLKSGQKLHFDHSVAVTLQRPAGLRVDRMGELVSQKFYYDGKSLSIFNASSKYYATLPAPPTLEAMLDFARDELDITAPAADLLYKDAYGRLTQDLSGGFIVGKASIMGARTDHLAFTGKEVDWQIWVEDGARPLPRKYIITSKLVAGAPEFIVLLDKWDLAPKVDAGAFKFAPPRDAKKIEFITATPASTAKR